MAFFSPSGKRDVEQFSVLAHSLEITLIPAVAKQLLASRMNGVGLPGALSSSSKWEGSHFASHRYTGGGMRKSRLMLLG